MSKKLIQVETDGYKEGFKTGLIRGYKKGIEDALKISQSILEDNGINMASSEFYLEMQNLIDEGEIQPPGTIIQ